ncbi:hypothetical protein [Oscillatoria nigro-viridis]|uniref:hypothetical protein n=1 Tax=Phormidium nigroviride TaxID=482564 RepID=UPI0002DA3472|nr:hypothetical protein [Oscillatoria nigro-viridis]
MRFWHSGEGALKVLPVSAVAIGAGIMPDRQSNLVILDFFKYKLVDRTQGIQTRQTK